MKHTLSIDIETFSTADIKSCGAHRYVDDAEFEILLFAYSFDFGPTQIIDLKSGESIPINVVAAIQDPSYIKRAYNASFERTCLAKYFNTDMPPEQWECDMVLGAVCGMPLGLENVSKALGLPEDKAKMKVGKDLIRYFCVPCKPTKANGQRTRNLPEHAPEKWELFKEYCKRDVEAENEIYKRFEKYTPDADEHRFWCLDQRINDRGVLIDMDLVDAAMDLDTKHKDVLTEEAIQLSGLANPNSVAQIKDWIKAMEDLDIESLNKKALPDVMEQIQSDKVKDFLSLRAELSKTSVKKYEAMKRCVCSDGRAKGLFQFYGTRTGRFAGRLIQLQNLPQNHMDDITEVRELVKQNNYEHLSLIQDNISGTLSELIRTAIIPAPGHKFLVCDFSAIEARVIAWFAKEEWVLEEFRGDGLIYEATASQMFGIPKEQIKKGGIHSDLRPKGKVAQLACGYGGAVGSLLAFGADKMGMTDEDMQNTVTLWRKANPNIVNWWWSIDKAAQYAIQNRCSCRDSIGGVLFSYEDGLLFATLPSGRRLCYYNTKIETGKFGKPTITYLGMDQTTRKLKRIETYGPKLVENIVQATARDCLRESMMALYDEGYNIVMHVHDEVICEEPIGGRTIDDMEKIMGREIAWAPGLPLRGDGDELMFYKKS